MNHTSVSVPVSCASSEVIRREARRWRQSSVVRTWKGVSKFTLPVATWWLQELVVGPFVVLFFKETKRELFEKSETVCSAHDGAGWRASGSTPL